MWRILEKDVSTGTDTAFGHPFPQGRGKNDLFWHQFSGQSRLKEELVCPGRCQPSALKKSRFFVLPSEPLYGRTQTKKGAAWPHRFQEIREWNPAEQILVVPRHGSENRVYIPFTFADGNDIVADSCLMIPGAGLWEFGILSSAMHMAWVGTVCGRMKSSPRYSAELCWNPFPWPSADDAQRVRIEELANAVLAMRDRHLYTCLRDMYEPGKMPTDLREAHRALDLAVDELYRPGKPFESDGERLRLLFQLYEELAAGAKEE